MLIRLEQNPYKFPYNEKSHFQRFPYLLSRKGLIPRNITMRRNNNSNINVASCNTLLHIQWRSKSSRRNRSTVFPLRGAFFSFLFFPSFFLFPFFNKIPLYRCSRTAQTGRRHLRRLKTYGKSSNLVTENSRGCLRSSRSYPVSL